MHHLIYLHGFLSSPLSVKAIVTQDFLVKHYPATNIHIPQLSSQIDKAIIQLESLVTTVPHQELRFIGSSMGGFLATYAVEKFGGKAVLINPAVEPHRLLRDYIGKHTNPYSGEEFHIHSGHLSMLQSSIQAQLKVPANYMVLLQTGDETLDYRLAAEKYKDTDLVIEQGGDHSFINYAAWLPKIFDFLR